MKIQNPLFRVDMPDPDVLRVGDAWYMVSTTMFYMPGAPILKSKDLCHFEIVSYIFDTIEDNEIYRLENGKNAYGKGQWATSLTMYQGKIYACFVCNDMQKTYIYATDNIEKSGWDKVADFDAIYHDMSFLFWEGKSYLIYGNGDIYLIELNDDLNRVKGESKLLFCTQKDGIMLRCEGCRAYVRNGFIYLLFIDWPTGGKRRELCYRTNDLNGEWEYRILMDDDMGYDGHGIAQGILTEDDFGNTYAILFQDRDASGRMPYLLPAKWENDWPVLGEWRDGAYRVPESVEVPLTEVKGEPLVCNDSFLHTENRLKLQWQWNHNPDPDGWSFTERPGYLRLMTNRLSSDLMDARNTLTQRTIEPGCICEVKLDVSGMKSGDYAGLTAFQGRYGQIGVYIEDGERFVCATRMDENGEKRTIKVPFHGEALRLRVQFDYREHKDLASFYYQNEEGKWEKLGEDLQMVYTLDLFVGYRIGLFYYATEEIGGYADFCDFVIKEL